MTNPCKKNTLIIGLALMSSAVAQNTNTTKNQLMIPAAPTPKAGQCYALVNVPAGLTQRIEQVPVKEAGEILSIIPAKYEWVEKKIPIADEQKTIEIIPATYKTVQEKIIVEPESKQYEIIPATYQTVQEKILTKPALRVWKKPSNSLASLNGEVMRLIEQPAQYKTITKQVMVKPPRAREIIIPAKYATIEKKVINKPAAVREVIIPAQFKTIRVRQLVKKAIQIKQPTKAEMQAITRQVVVSPAQLKWQRILCDRNLTEKNIIAIQKKLKTLGYDITADGKFGKGSRQALEAFQESKGLAKGALTIETMKALRISIK